jgi:ATP-binding cassette subfamily F protein 3
MIIFKNITLRRGPAPLIEGLDWSIFPGQRIGLVGANGAGKSSIFAMLRGELSPDRGELSLPKQWEISHLEQETPGTSQTALDYVLTGDPEYCRIEADLQAAELSGDGEKIAHLHDQLHAIDGYTAPSRAGQLLAGLGFSGAEQKMLVSEFSGGWRMRLNLGKALMCRSDMLLLDEPTNHLDLDAVLWLESWIKQYKGTLILISHDRDFLDGTVNIIAHVYDKKLTVYTGDYSTFEKTRAMQLTLQQALHEKQQKHVDHLKSFINRFGAKASKAKQAQSRVKALARLEVVSAVQQESPFNFEFRKPDQCPHPLMQCDHVSVKYDERTIISKVNVGLSPRDRIGILGPNGAGKSSLIKLLAGEINTASGLRETAAGLRIGYFAQHQVDHLSLPDTILIHLQRIAPQQSEQTLRTYLGTFGFVGDEVFGTVGALSGGEKSRLALALLVWQKPNLLLLDEPTNHLDMEMRNALSLALQDFEGAMMIVSHDRFLLRATVDQFILVADGAVQAFDGDLDDYEKWLVNYRKRQALPKPKEAVVVEEKIEKTTSKMSYKEEQTLAALPKQIEADEAALEKLQALTAQPDFYDQPQEDVAQVMDSLAALQTKLNAAYEQWEALEQKQNQA